MRPLWLVNLLAGGQRRLVLVVGSTAALSALLLVGVAILRVPDGPRYGPGPHNLGVIADPGTAPGAAFGALLAALPLVLLVDQVVRLGSAARRRRYAALTAAGSTGADLRRWGAAEVGIPAACGAVLGIPLWWLLRIVLGDGLATSTGALVPIDATPGIVGSLLVILGVAGYGALTGWRSGARMQHVLVETHGLRPPPRPVSLLLVLAGLVILLAQQQRILSDSDIMVLVALGLIVLGVVGLAPWVAYLAARAVAARTGSPAVLLAAGRLTADARAAGRAGAAVAGVALAAGVLGGYLPDVLDSQGGDREYYVVPALVVGAIALAALLVIATSLGVHSVDAAVTQRRELATLVAVGTPPSVLFRAQQAESLLVTVPLALLGLLLGGAGYGYLTKDFAMGLVVALLITLPLVVGAAVLVPLALRSHLSAAFAADNLRTE